MHPDFAHVTTWVFDLDETLYPPSMPLFPQIEARMTRWIEGYLGVSDSEADRLRSRWWHDHGTTLAGLMREHDMDPDPFLEDVHDIDFSVLSPDPALRAALAALPGRRVIFTNGTEPYARAVLDARGLTGLWDAVHGIEHADYIPKPHPGAYRAIFARDGLAPRQSAMFEDMSRNLEVPCAMGLATVHVAPERAPGDHIQHHAADLTEFLCGILASGPASPGA